MERLASCIERIRDWMADNHLKLNEEKTRIIWLGTRQQLNKLSAQALTLPNATVVFSTAVLHGQSRCCTQPILFFLHPATQVSYAVTDTTSSRIDYCVNVFTGISGQLLQRLQAIQSAAARLITGARRPQHVTPILRQLHWLPIRQLILFKTLVHKSRYDMLRLTSRHTARKPHHTTVGVIYAPLCLDNTYDD